MDKGAHAKGGMVRKRGHVAFLKGFFNEIAKRISPSSRAQSDGFEELLYDVLSRFPADLLSI